MNFFIGIYIFGNEKIKFLLLVCIIFDDLEFFLTVIGVLQKAYPLRLKHIHIMFPPSFIDVAKNIMKPFLSKKMFARVSVKLTLHF